MGRTRKPAEPMTPEKARSSMLVGITNPVAVALFDEGMRVLEERGEANFLAMVQLREAAQWTVIIDDLQTRIIEMSAVEDAARKVTGLMKTKREAEESRRRLLDSLLLMPKKPRGRPAASGEPAAEQDEPVFDDWDNWDAPTVSGDDATE